MQLGAARSMPPCANVPEKNGEPPTMSAQAGLTEPEGSAGPAAAVPSPRTDASATSRMNRFIEPPPFSVDATCSVDDLRAQRDREAPRRWAGRCTFHRDRDGVSYEVVCGIRHEGDER